MNKRTGKRQSRTRVTDNKVLKHRTPKRATAAGRKAAWRKLEKLWSSVVVNSKGDRMTRDELHERR
jgi:hypothetical protein